jgi:hypothetical protein
MDGMAAWSVCYSDEGAKNGDQKVASPKRKDQTLGELLTN